MRGEDTEWLLDALDKAGSPPHARGRRAHGVVPRITARITPACAGKTSPGQSRRDAAPDHPRMRGEDDGDVEDTVRMLGSPPHARGRPAKYKGEHNAHRITPACAGKTCGGCAPIRRPVDHPRMRGEDWLVFVSEQTLCGSPPHARGRRGLVGQGPADFWITPACAGKTIPSASWRTTSPDHPRMRGEDEHSSVGCC